MAILRTEFLEFVDCQLKSLVQSLPSYIEDTTHFLLQLEQMGPLPDDAILVTLDVSSLSALTFLTMQRRRQNKTLPTERICDLIRMTLGMHNFSFNNEHLISYKFTELQWELEYGTSHRDSSKSRFSMSSE